MISELYIGIMSGTSLDGIDLALVSIKQKKIKLLKHHFVPMPPDLTIILKQLIQSQTTALSHLGNIDSQLGSLYAKSVLALLHKTQYSAEDIIAIGCHGQTIYHQPVGKTPFTMQIGDANIIAAKTHITTVADFRRKDIAQGGQGAPLVPAFHQSLFTPTDSTIVVMNIGGIANVSCLQPKGETLGFDTGPGNCLLDEWCELHTKCSFDKDGQFANTGNTNKELLDLLLADPYFSHSFPKSTGREYFNLTWLHSYLTLWKKNIPPEDIQRTLVELTVQSSIQAITPLAHGNQPSLVVCGGGAHNPIIMDDLKKKLPEWLITTSKNYGINEDYMEAMAFAWLAYRRIHHLPGNLPDVTGAEKKTTLGCVYLAE